MRQLDDMFLFSLLVIRSNSPDYIHTFRLNNDNKFYTVFYDVK